MVFTAPPSTPNLPLNPPDDVSVSHFMLNEKYGRKPFEQSRNPFTCGLSGRTYTAADQLHMVDHLARSLSSELGWKANTGSEWDKVAAVFSCNTINYMTLVYAIHELGGIATPVNAAYSASELEFQLESSGAKVLFTCDMLLDTALEVAKKVGISNDRIFVLETPKEVAKDRSVPLKTVECLIAEGQNLPEFEPSKKWEKGQGARQTAYLCYSSGTSGLPKGVMISHQNVITNILQIKAHGRPARGENTEVCLGLLPLSHIYGLVVIAHGTTYRGDEVIILPKFELPTLLASIQKHRINTLYIVPPIVIQLINGKSACSKYDLSSVRVIFSGAAPLGKETAERLLEIHPSWIIAQGYGLTETCTVVCMTAAEDVWLGSCGKLLPEYNAKLISPEGVEITAYDTPGELVVQSKSVVLGYLNNAKANKETFLEDIDGKGRWMRTGDEAEFRKSPSGTEHVYIVDRIKELIKVKGMQVAPAELEAFILSHPSVADCAVIPIPDDAAGEVPKAFVVKSSSISFEESDKRVRADIMKYVEKNKARHKWLKGGVEFIDVIPKSPSGKILRRLLRDKEKDARRARGAKL